MKRVICLLLFFISVSLHAQDFVIDEGAKVDSIKPVLSLIPFQSIYYRSEIDRSLAKNESIDYQSLTYSLRKELDRQLFMILSDKFNVNSLLKDNSEEDQELLDYIFYSTASSYTKLESQEKVERNLLQRGQIKEAPLQEEQRYMKTLIHNPNLMDSMEDKLPSDYYLFIGELDILLPQTIEEKESNRNIYVHFTLYNRDAEIVDSGIVSQMIPERKCKSIKDISNDGFAPVAYQFNDLLKGLCE